MSDTALLVDGARDDEVHDATVPARHWWALGVLCLTAFMIVVDGTTVVSALPAIQDEFGMTSANLQWIVTIYTLAFGGFMLLGGRVADLVGRRRMLIVSMVVFLGASILCGLAWSGGVLIGARALQGLGAAFVMPAALSLIMTMFPDGAQRHRALGVWGAVAGIGGSAGFVVGGPLIDGPGWEWIYFMNVPIGVVVLALAPYLLPESRDQRTSRRLDITGATIGTAALVLLVYGVSDVVEIGWSHPRTIGVLGAAVALAALFIRIEQRTESPLVPLHLFRLRMLTGGNLVLVAAGMSMGFMVMMSLYAQQVLNYSAGDFGRVMLVTGLPALPLTFVASAAVTRFGTRPVVIAGTLLMGTGLTLLVRVPSDGEFVRDLLAPLLLLGAGMAPMSVGASIAALSGVDDDDSGVASGIEESGFQLSLPIGVAILTTIALTRADAVGGPGVDPLEAQTSGFRYAFAAAAAFMLIAAAVAVVVMREPMRVAADDVGAAGSGELGDGWPTMSVQGDDRFVLHGRDRHPVGGDADVEHGALTGTGGEAVDDR